jgi:hypothetical protein
MEQTTGVFIERNMQGIPSYARIDLNKYGKRLMPFFKEIGIDKEFSAYSDQFVNKIKQSRKEYESGQYQVVDPEKFWER